MNVIEETYIHNGVKFILTDTAGVRESDDIVEKIGIEKQFRKVVKDIKKAILKRKDIGDVLAYVNGEGIEFDEN
mgnify:CR=1 FL=1